MATNYLHGIETIEVSDSIVSIQTVKSGVIGLIGTAPGRDIDAFPTNYPILIAGDQRATLDFGTTGTIPDALDSIFNITGAVIVAVVIEEGSSPVAATKRLQTYANLVGNVTAKTGVHTFRQSSGILGLVPKLLLAPGFTAERPADGIIANAVVNTGGTGYTQANTTAVVTGDGQGAHANVLVNGSGAVQAVIFDKPGVGYTNVTVTIVGDGTGAKATATIGQVANPVAIELVAVAPFLRAMVLVDSQGLSYQDALNYRLDFDSDRIKIIEGGFMKFDANIAQNIIAPAAPYAAGMQAWLDNNKGFWFDFSNWPITGPVGVGRAIDWSFYDSSVEGQLLNGQAVAITVRDNGFRIMGDRVPTTDSDWMFWSVRRTADMVYESIEQALRDAVDKPISRALVQWIEDSVNDGAILGGRAYLDPNFNSPAALKAGNLTIDFDLEPPAPLERLTFRAHRNSGYYTDLVTSIVATQASLSAAA